VAFRSHSSKSHFFLWTFFTSSRFFEIKKTVKNLLFYRFFLFFLINGYICGGNKKTANVSSTGSLSFFEKK
jgi:hypothetical protein